jgi:N-acetylneuraminate synthase
MKEGKAMRHYGSHTGDDRVYIVAEMSGNHNQSLERAFAIIDAAADCGVDAMKIQTYTADTMTIDATGGAFTIEDPKSLWKGKSLYELYKEAHTPWEWHKPIFDRCKERGLSCFSTPFDDSAVDFLESLNAPFYKIASFENTDLPLVRKVAATGKPVIISTGMASLAELDETVRAARGAGCTDLTLLKCTSTYPASPADSNIRTIPHLREAFGTKVGLSDHTMGCGVAVASVALGVTLIEKHFTLSRADGGVDSAFSMEPAEMKRLVEDVRRAEVALGSVKYGPGVAETASLKFRRSLYAVADIKEGAIFDARNVRAIRPGLGLAPKFTEMVIGRKARTDIKRGTPLSWDLIG